jgi:hypothetical protein
MTMTSQRPASAECYAFSIRAPRFEFRVRLRRWFSVQIEEIVDLDEELVGVKN